MSNRPKLKRTPTPGYTQKPSSSTGQFPVWAIVALVAVAVIIAAVIAVGASSGGDEASPEVVEEAYQGQPTSDFREVEAEGAVLPQQPSDGVGTDPAIGQTAPILKGANFVNEPVTVGAGPSMIVFAAHWCHICQEEVPDVAGWINDGLLPAGVDASLVSTNVREDAGVDLPSAWVASTGWSSPVLVDNDTKDAAAMYGLEGFPMFVFVNEDGVVTQRASGALTREQIEQYLSEIAPAAK